LTNHNTVLAGLRRDLEQAVTSAGIANRAADEAWHWYLRKSNSEKSAWLLVAELQNAIKRLEADG